MKVIFDGRIFVDYGFVVLERDGPVSQLLLESRGGQRNGLCGAGVPGCLIMVTGRRMGQVPVRVEHHAAGPGTLDEDWQDVVEVSVDLGAGDYFLTSFDDGHRVDLPRRGPHRARWCAVGMDEAEDADSADEDAPAVDRYLLQLWPAPPAPDVVVRQGSRAAAYWHGVAAETPPPPPPPTAQEREETRARQRAEEKRLRREAQMREEVARWGGRPPTDELRRWGADISQFARADRDLLDDIVALLPEQQRALAAWAAGQSVERAGLLGRAEVVEALDHLARGEPLPQVWQDWGSAWDLLYPPPSGETASVTTVTVGWGDEPPSRQPLDAGASAISTLQAAADPHPGRAAARAVDALGHGAVDLVACFTQVRAVVADLRRT